MKELLSVLIEWINDELAEQRIIVKNIEEDLYDGQVLHKLWEKLTGRKLDVLEVTQSEEGQRQKLHIVLNAVNHVRNANGSFNVDRVIIYTILRIHRPLASTRKYRNGTLRVSTPRIWWPFYIYLLH